MDARGNGSPPWAASGAVRVLLGAGRRVFTELGQPYLPSAGYWRRDLLGLWRRGQSGRWGGGAEPGFWGRGGAARGLSREALD